MNDIKKLAREAKKALERLQGGKKYTSNYICRRLEAAKEDNPGDILIGNMRDVFLKKASTQEFVSQKEISDLYQDMYGLGGNHSAFREALGDLIFEKQASTLKQDASKNRIPYEKELKPLFEETDLSRELSGFYSLDKKASFSALSENTITKAAKFVRLQLESLDFKPSNVSVVKTNEHFILCNASVDTSDFTQVNVPVPVQVTNGMPTLPNSFIADNDLVKLNKENLYLFVKDKNNFSKKMARDKFADQRGGASLTVKTPEVPEALSRYADLDNKLIAAASAFTSDQVIRATAVVSAELASLGIRNSQVNLIGSDKGSLKYAAKISGLNTAFDANIVVDMPNGNPVIPTKFSSNGVEYKLNRPGLRSAIEKVAETGAGAVVTREVEQMGRLNYQQLIHELEAGASNGDYKRAENALLTIEAKFDSSKHLAAIDHYSKLLKHATGSTERDRLIKEAKDRGELINIPTSVQLYSPKLGLPISKIAFDEKGRMVPAARLKSSSDLSDSGAMISTSKISLS